MVLPYIDMNLPKVYTCSPSWTPLPLPSAYHSSGSSSAPASSILYHASICLTYDNIHASVLFSQIIPPLPSSTESKRLFYTSVSLLLSCIKGYRLSGSVKQEDSYVLFLTSLLFLSKQNSRLLWGTEIIVWDRLESPLVNIIFMTKLLSLNPLSWDMDCLMTLWPSLIPCSLGNGCCTFGFLIFIIVERNFLYHSLYILTEKSLKHFCSIVCLSVSLSLSLPLSLSPLPSIRLSL